MQVSPSLVFSVIMKGIYGFSITKLESEQSFTVKNNFAEVTKDKTKMSELPAFF